MPMTAAKEMHAAIDRTNAIKSSLANSAQAIRAVQNSVA
jgi:hypothetical protein